MERGGGRNHNPTTPPKYSPMTQEENDNISSRVFKLEDMFKGSMRTVDSFNLEEMIEKRMRNME